MRWIHALYLVLFLTIVMAVPAMAQQTAPPGAPPPIISTDERLNSLEKTSKQADDKFGVSINIVWTLVTGYMVIFMQAGFAMVECGFTRVKNVAHTACMNLMSYALSILAYWACGFAFQFGGCADANSVANVSTLGARIPETLNVLMGFNLGGDFIGLLGGRGFFLTHEFYDGGLYTLFLFQMIFGGTAAIIPTGAMAERWKFSAFALSTVCVCAFVYPLFGCWTWGGGWLAAMGKNWGYGHGLVDFAGSAVVHVCGGTLSLIWVWKLGPRYGKFNKDGSANAIPGHNVPMGVLGTLILAFGWFGFNPGSTLDGTDHQIGIIAVNTMLASAAGAVTGMLTSWARQTKPDPSFMCNGMLGGLVAITGPSAFVYAWAAVLIGAISGVLVVFATAFVEETLKLDDPVGAVPVHGANGVWGAIALGIFANGQYGDGLNKVTGKVTGLLYGNPMQLVAQLIGTLVCLTVMAFLAFIIYTIVDKLCGGHRPTIEEEIAGLDPSEIGIPGYLADVDPEPR
ncbi:MAG: ammonium transporter [Candidatus Methylacidiphilales bacterium]|nr:ammonium transporter [Candidatus Methylacidiphilales bacterium]